MLDKLRRQFILIIMALVTAALAIMAGVIVFINYQQLSSDVLQSVEYATTALAFEDRELGARPDARKAESAPGRLLEEGKNPPEWGIARDADAGDGEGRDARVQRAASADMVATSVYLLQSDGTLGQTLVNALELDESSLNQALASAVAASQEAPAANQGECITGHLPQGNLYFGARSTPSGTKVAFASGSYIANSIANLGLVLAAVSAGVWAAFLLISVALARWVVRPTERAWAQQQQFVADASHELKTPLAVMMANNSILLSNAGETVESQRRWVESNQEEARQMLGLVNDLLFLARPENAERQVLQESVDFSALVQRNSLQFEAVCFERGVSLEEEIQAGITVRGDANRLQRLVSTLIDNACKYADTQVRIALSHEGGQVRLALTNDGATIPPEDLPHVFDRFYRVDKARVRSEGGVGLGLAIAQEVAREHGGSLAVTSSPEKGTTFTATLPCR